MISDYRCFFCFTKAYERLLEEGTLSASAKDNFTRDMAALYLKHCERFSAPYFSRDLHIALNKYTNNPDPHREGKKLSNDLVLAMYNELKEKVQTSVNPFDTALR
ncbi:MAG TPA: ARMT1-like domain-containing protein, partial [Bacteroidales bacterium]